MRKSGHQRPVNVAPEHEGTPMDIEHINALGNQLADLRERTAQLRGYL